MSRDIAPFGVRMPDDLKKNLELSAKKNGRSLNAEVVARLEETVKQDDFLGSSKGHAFSVWAIEQNQGDKSEEEQTLSSSRVKKIADDLERVADILMKKLDIPDNHSD